MSGAGEKRTDGERKHTIQLSSFVGSRLIRLAVDLTSLPPLRSVPSSPLHSVLLSPPPSTPVVLSLPDPSSCFSSSAAPSVSSRSSWMGVVELLNWPRLRTFFMRMEGTTTVEAAAPPSTDEASGTSDRMLLAVAGSAVDMVVDYWAVEFETRLCSGMRWAALEWVGRVRSYSSRVGYRARRLDVLPSF